MADVHFLRMNEESFVFAPFTHTVAPDDSVPAAAGVAGSLAVARIPSHPDVTVHSVRFPAWLKSKKLRVLARSIGYIIPQTPHIINVIDYLCEDWYGTYLYFAYVHPKKNNGRPDDEAVQFVRQCKTQCCGLGLVCDAFIMSLRKDGRIFRYKVDETVLGPPEIVYP